MRCGASSTVQLRFAPGSGYGYSDAGYTVAAAVIEQGIEGSPFEAFLRERILERGRHAVGGILRGPVAAVAGGDRVRRPGGPGRGRPRRVVARVVVAEGRRWRRRIGSGPAHLDAPALERQGAGAAAQSGRSTRSSAEPERLPQRAGFVLGYAGANDYGFNSAVAEGHRGRRVVIALTNAGGNRAERLALRIAPLLFPRLALARRE